MSSHYKLHLIKSISFDIKYNTLLEFNNSIFLLRNNKTFDAVTDVKLINKLRKIYFKAADSDEDNFVLNEKIYNYTDCKVINAISKNKQDILVYTEEIDGDNKQIEKIDSLEENVITVIYNMFMNSLVTDITNTNGVYNYSFTKQ